MEDSVNDFGAFRDARLFDEDLDQEDDEWVGVTNLSLDVPEVLSTLLCLFLPLPTRILI